MKHAIIGAALFVLGIAGGLSAEAMFEAPNSSANRAHRRIDMVNETLAHHLCIDHSGIDLSRYKGVDCGRFETIYDALEGSERP